MRTSFNHKDSCRMLQSKGRYIYHENHRILPCLWWFSSTILLHKHNFNEFWSRNYFLSWLSSHLLWPKCEGVYSSWMWHKCWRSNTCILMLQRVENSLINFLEHTKISSAHWQGITICRDSTIKLREKYLPENIGTMLLNSLHVPLISSGPSEGWLPISFDALCFFIIRVTMDFKVKNAVKFLNIDLSIG